VRRLLFVQVLLWEGCAFGGGGHVGARHVSHAATAVSVASLACDGGSTERFLAHGDEENNPVLGSHPSHLRLWSYLTAWAAAAVLADRVLSPRWNVAAQAALTTVEGVAVVNNRGLGVGWCGLGSRGGER
jgi:hypothetical protein